MQKNLKLVTKTNSNLLKEVAVAEAEKLKKIEPKVRLKTGVCTMYIRGMRI